MTYDQPNREALGLPPIWAGAGDPQDAPEPEDDEEAPTTAKSKAAKKT